MGAGARARLVGCCTLERAAGCCWHAAATRTLHADYSRIQPFLGHTHHGCGFPSALHARIHTATCTRARAVDPAPQERPLCVVNTHLFFHPYAPHIRAMHTAAILEEAHAVVGAWCSGGNGCGGAGGQAQAQGQGQAQGQRQRPALLFCGDLNSDLNDGVPGVCVRGRGRGGAERARESEQARAQHACPCSQGGTAFRVHVPGRGCPRAAAAVAATGVIELLQTGALPADHWDWFMGAEFRWGMVSVQHIAYDWIGLWERSSGWAW